MLRMKTGYGYLFLRGLLAIAENTRRPTRMREGEEKIAEKTMLYLVKIAGSTVSLSVLPRVSVGVNSSSRVPYVWWYQDSSV